MKKKILIGFATALFAVFTLVNFGIVSNNQKINVSLDDIFHMATADGETPCENNCPNSGLGCIIHYSNGTYETCPDAHT